MKRVLLTNLYFARYTGSELHVLEVARLFEKKGYEVTVAVFQKAYPLLKQAGTINIVDCFREELKVQEYDIIWVQHYPVFDFLSSKYDLTYKKLIISKLSVINELEYLPVCVPEADMILCVSQECANQVREDIGNDKRIKVFKNSVSEEFFTAGNEKREYAQIKKIAVISNHVPQELLELERVMGGHCKIDYIGLEYEPRFVDATLLQQYDLVITIGRTVQQCFAAKVPVYVYDYFGGPGYINDDNFALAEKNNFSGRGGFEKRSSTELKIDIEEKYKNNLNYLEKLNSIAKKEYSYTVNFDEIYSELMKGEVETIKRVEMYKGIERLRMMTYGRSIPSYAFFPSYTSKLYVDFGEGFNETDSIKWNSSDNYVIVKKIEIDKSVRALRFDPCDEPSECLIYEVYINGKLKEECSNTKADFFAFDPQFAIVLSDEERKIDNLCVEIHYKFRTHNWKESLDTCNANLNKMKTDNVELQCQLKVLQHEVATSQRENEELQRELQLSQNEVQYLQKLIEEIKAYYKVTPKNILKRILGVFRR